LEGVSRNMRSKRFMAIPLFTIIVIFGVAAQAASQDDDILYWTCGMHPSVKEDEPGKCPICNMDLVPVMRETEREPSGEREVELDIGAEAARLARIRTVEIVRMVLVKRIESPGELAYDETRMAVISSRVNGWIERLHADYTGMELHKGEPLAEIYSPELVSAQKEFLLARGTNLEKAAREKLILLGIMPDQIREIEGRSETATTLFVRAPIGGTILHRNVTEGERIARGQTLFHMADLSRLWIVARIFESDLGLVEIGQEASVTSDAFPGEEIMARVTFIEPTLDARTRSAAVRLEIPNPDRRHRPGTFVRVTFEIPITGEAAAAQAIGRMDHAGHEARAVRAGRGVIAVPRSAVVNTGRRSVAFVEIEPGRYEMRNVKIGPATEDYYVVLEGLAEGERVVERGSFLLDSQTQLSGEAEEIYGGAIGKESDKADPHPGHKH
jgi:Cu(I)/Ag(I) efflux system membrane fusion protein